VREDHDAEKPAKSGRAHEKSNKNGPPENGTIALLFFGKVAASIRAVFAAIAQKSNVHSICEKFIKVIEIEMAKFYWFKNKRKGFFVNKLK
jgi:hypothetical protein